MLKTPLKTYLLAATAAAAIAAPLSAHAAGYALKEQSVSGQGTSFAGVTAGGNGDLSAMFFNPAALGMVKNFEFVQTVTGIIPTSRVESASATRVTGSRISGTASPGDIAQDAVLPSGYIGYAVTPDLNVGLSMNGPWGLVTDYGDNWVGRYHGIRSDLRTYNFTPTISYRVHPTLTLGAGLQIQYAKAKLSSAIDAGLLANPALAGRLDTLVDLQGDAWGLGATAGLMYEPMKGTRVGLSYRSAVKHKLKGDADFSGPAATAATFRDQSISAKLVTPDSANFGVYHELTDRWSIMGDVQWTNWSKFYELNVDFQTLANSITDERWKDTWFVSLGTAYKVTDALTVRGGIAFDQGSVGTEHRTPRIPEQDRYWLSIGAGYKVTEWLQLDAAYSHVFVRDAEVALRDTGTGTNRGRGNLNVKYENSIDIIGVQARLTF
ncbi:OmpP1/FadL family transporter [Azospirillum sp.]|uniref:OmpP1/FadL family transporter n=1 Tax=Azospirillum sp. TaxID=34012 RepID=UPI003D71F60D